MAGLVHGSARTTPRVRAELQAAQAGSRALAAQYGLNPKTVLKWRGRDGTADAPMVAPKLRSTVLTEAEEAIVVEFRRRTLLPLDDVLGCLKDQTPTLTRSALHRCLVRHRCRRFPGGKSAELTRGMALTPNASTKWDLSRHVFDRVCDEPCTRSARAPSGGSLRDGIEHRLTKPYHPWTNGQAERMNRTVKDATTKAFHHAQAPEAIEGREPPGARARLRVGLQLRQAPQSPTLANPLPGDLRRLESGPVRVEDQPAPPHPGITHLASARSRPAAALMMRSYDAATLARGFGAKPTEIRTVLAGTLEAERTRELTDLMRAAGVPL